MNLRHIARTSQSLLRSFRNPRSVPLSSRALSTTTPTPPSWSDTITATSQHTLTSLHDSLTALPLPIAPPWPWAGTLILSAISLRLLTLPLVYHNQIHVGRAALAAKEHARIQQFVRRTPGSLLHKYLTFRRLRNLTLRSAGTSSLQTFRWHLVCHVPLVISASFGVRALAINPPAEWTDGGIAFFQDLSVADPLGFLPVFTTALWVWNLDPRSARMPESRVEKVKENGDGKVDRNALIERFMNRTGDGFMTLLQVLAVASLSFTKDFPAGILLFWATNGVVTSAQRSLLTNDWLRRKLGLLTKEDLARMDGPPVLKGVGLAYSGVKKELEFVQRELLSVFDGRPVDDALVREVDRMLERERRQGRLSVRLKAVLRSDEGGARYVAVVRRE